MKASVSFQGSGNVSPALGTHKSSGIVGISFIMRGGGVLLIMSPGSAA